METELAYNEHNEHSITKAQKSQESKIFQRSGLLHMVVLLTNYIHSLCANALSALRTGGNNMHEQRSASMDFQ